MKHLWLGSIELLQIPLCNESFNIALSDIKLAVLSQCNSTVKPLVLANPSSYQQRHYHIPVFCLDFASVLQHSNIDEEILWWQQATGEIDIGVLSFECSK